MSSFILSAALCGASLILASSLQSLGADEKTGAEKIAAVKLFEAPVSAKGEAGGVWASPVVRHGDSVIFAWFGSDNTIWIGRWQPDKEVERFPVHKVETRVHDKMTPSLGIDSRGHIHLAAGMHNGGWEYWVNEAPNDLSSFRKVEPGDPLRPPGDRVTYPRFIRAKDGTLFLSYRTRAASGALLDKFKLEEGRDTKYLGMMSGALAKSKDGVGWEALGAVAPMNSPLLPVVAWEASGRAEDDGSPGWYQTFRNKTVFDKEGTLHYAGVIYGPGSQSAKVKNGASYLIYAKSRDSGLTFQKADGTPVSNLPLGSGSADVVIHAEPGDLSTDTSVGVDANGNPMIFYQRGNPGKGFMARWEPEKGWVHSESPLGEATVVDGQGTITGVTHDGSLMRSRDRGQTWQTFTIEDETASKSSDKVAFDPVQALENGEILLRRLVRNAQNETVMQVYSVTFNPEN